jgi:hypothetical protein
VSALAAFVGYLALAALLIGGTAVLVMAACGAVQALLNRHSDVVAARTRREIGTAMTPDTVDGEWCYESEVVRRVG